MGKVNLKIILHKRGLGLKGNCVMNMTLLCCEYEGG